MESRILITAVIPASGFDDFAFTAVPEPSTSLLGLFGSLRLFRRRRQLIARAQPGTKSNRAANP